MFLSWSAAIICVMMNEMMTIVPINVQSTLYDMPRRRRHVSSRSVAESEPNDAAPTESVPETVSRDEPTSTDDLVPYESGPSTKPNSHNSGKVSSNYWTVNLKDGVPLDQWAGFLGYRDRDETKLMVARNTANQARQRIPHILGAMTIARKRDLFEMKTERPCSQAEMYVISHKRKDGSYVSNDARDKYKELQTRTQLSSEDDAYIVVFGKQHPGRVRGMGQGVCPSRMFGSSSRVGGSSSGEYICKSDYEVNIQKMIDEINLLKAEMAEMRQNMHPSRQTSNQVENLGSQAPTQGSGNVRHSSSSSHEPHN